LLIENWQLPSPTDWGLHGFRAYALTEDVLLVEAVDHEVVYQDPVLAAGYSSRVNGAFRQRCLSCFLGLKRNLVQQSSDWVNSVEWAPAYVSMGIRFDPTLLPIEQLWEELKRELKKELTNAPVKANELASNPAQVFELPVCYDKGLDWPRIEDLSGFSKDEFIQQHSRGEYWVAAMGFLPGFTFLDGLESALSLPRLDAPRKRIPAGTVGIGGAQTGWYALSSPGGWNSLGETPWYYWIRGRVLVMKTHHRCRWATALDSVQ
jgi:KipI family sensor histidine kinase inhibitor